MGVKITDKYTREWTQMAANIKLMKANPVVKVGVLDGSGAHRPKSNFGSHIEGLTVAKVGTFHEFGTPTIPRRSFLRGTVDERKDEIVQKMADSLEKLTVGTSSPSLELGRIGAWLAGQVKKFISAGIDPALAPSTIEAKGSSKPLIDTGQLRQSITHEVVASDKGGEGEVTRA